MKVIALKEHGLAWLGSAMVEKVFPFHNVIRSINVNRKKVHTHTHTIHPYLLAAFGVFPVSAEWAKAFHVIEYR